MEIKEKLKNAKAYETDTDKYTSILIDSNRYSYSHCSILIPVLQNFITQKSVIQNPSLKSENNINLLKNLSLYLNKECNQILLNNSINMSVSNILKLYATNKSKIIIFIPTNSVYENLSSTITDKIIKIQLNTLKSGKQDLQLDLYNLSDSFNNNRTICFLSNPNNPTGYEWTEIELKRMFKKYPYILFIIDESYIDFSIISIEETNIYSCTNCINEFNNIIILRSFSKSFGLKGLGIEYIISNYLNIISLQKITYHKNITELSKLAANVILDNISFYRNQIHILFQDKKKIVDYCITNNIKHIDTKCNFILIYCGNYSNKLKEIFIENNVIIKSLDDEYPNLLNGYIRINIHINYTYIIICILDKYKDELINCY